MLKIISYSLIAFMVLACGKDSKKSGDATRDSLNLTEVKPFSIAGTYAQVENGIARLEINSWNVVTGTTLAIPSPAGDGTRLTPQFPQQLLFNETEGYFSTLGTFNDGSTVFKNIELRIRPYSGNTRLDVTLVYPPDVALSHSCNANKTGTVTVTDHGKGSKPNPAPTPTCSVPSDPTQSSTAQSSAQSSGTPSQNDPGQNTDDTCSCPSQLFYVYQFQRI